MDRFGRAFEEVLAQPLDRRILVELVKAGREVRYEELRKVAGVTAPQTFKYAIDRLTRRAMVSRRLEEQGERYLSHISPTPRGIRIAGILRSLAEEGRLPGDLPAREREDIREAFLGAAH